MNTQFILSSARFCALLFIAASLPVMTGAGGSFQLGTAPRKFRDSFPNRGKFPGSFGTVSPTGESSP
ncbi:MAG: hypothetical protein LBJ47_05975 [Tannerella sp.]|nr:hypothetical protein [Tannerella sp.]